MKRPLKDSHPLIPQGEQVLRIKEVDDKDYSKFEKITVILEDVNGIPVKCNFNFVKDDGTANDVAEGIYTRMCRAALNDQTLDECDWDDIVGCFVRVEIEHNEGSKGGTFANIKKWVGPAEKFDKTPAAKPATSRPSGGKPAAASKTTPTANPEPPVKKSAAEILAEMRARKAAGK